AIVVDRVVVNRDDRGRLADSVETALKLSDGLVEVKRHDNDSSNLFSEKFGCPDCGTSLTELEPRQFSFNSPFGACAKCGGLGTRREVSEDLILGDGSLTIPEGVVLPWGEPDGYLRRTILPGLARELKFNLDTPWGELPQKIRDALLYGSSGRRGGNATVAAARSDAKWEGIISNVQRRYDETESDAVRLDLEQFMMAL